VPLRGGTWRNVDFTSSCGGVAMHASFAHEIPAELLTAAERPAEVARGNHHMKLAVSGTYSSGKTRTVMTLAHYTGIPRTLAKTIRELTPTRCQARG
jgi:hypothetical protein